MIVGLSVRVAGAVGMGRLLRSQLFGTTPVDPVLLVTIVGILTAVACVVPARRAARVDPMVALRSP